MSKNRNFPTENTAAAFLYGRHPVIAAIANPQRIINSIFCTKENTEELKNACAKAAIRPIITTLVTMSEAQTKSHIDIVSAAAFVTSLKVCVSIFSLAKRLNHKF